MTIFLYLLFGFIAGVFGGLGMGGGTLLIPLLSIFLGLDQKMCQGINLLSFLIMAIFSLIIHYRNGFVKTRGIIYIILSGIVFSILGSSLVTILPSKLLRICFGFFLCLLAIIEFFKIFKNKKKEGK